MRLERASGGNIAAFHATTAPISRGVTGADSSYAHWVEPQLRLHRFDAPQQRPDGSPVGAVGVPQVLYVPAIAWVMVSLLS